MVDTGFYTVGNQIERLAEPQIDPATGKRHAALHSLGPTVARVVGDGKPQEMVLRGVGGHYILRMDEKEVVRRLGPPDEILTRKDRMRRQGWMCADCYDVVRSEVPIPVPAPCHARHQ